MLEASHKITGLILGDLCLQIAMRVLKKKDFIPVLAVDGVPVSWRVDHSEAELHASLLDLYRRRLDLDRPLDLLCLGDKQRQNSHYDLYEYDLKIKHKNVGKCCVLPAAPGITLSGYRSVRNRLLIRVDFPSPDSPF